MYKVRNWGTASLAPAVGLTLAALAQPAMATNYWKHHYKPPVISEVTVDFETTRELCVNEDVIVIRGRYFLDRWRNPRVYLGSHGALEICDDPNSEEIVAILPIDLPDGDYKLTVAKGGRKKSHGHGNDDDGRRYSRKTKVLATSFDLTITSMDYQGGSGGQGPMGPMGPLGPMGPAGQGGPSGPAGPQGVAGQDGLSGPAGPMGPAGPAGSQGIAGQDGLPGPVGPQGVAGQDGLPGPAGPAGLQGVAGPVGPAGQDGLAGPAGPAGQDGLPGPAGPQGVAGPVGPAGQDGLAGPAGPAGPAGQDGLPGLAGPAGPQGVAGPVGPAGQDGLAGTAGPAGQDGLPGPVGPEGPQGLAGPVGPDGPVGPVGPQGSIGLVGPAGPAGPQGLTGLQGPVGPVGPLGPTGPQGPTGQDGSVAASTCAPNEYVNGIDTDGSLICGSLHQFVNQNCSIYFGWKDNARINVPGWQTPNYIGRVSDSSCELQGNREQACLPPQTVLGHAGVRMFALNTEGLVDSTDKFYIGLKCE